MLACGASILGAVCGVSNDIVADCVSRLVNSISFEIGHKRSGGSRTFGPFGWGWSVDVMWVWGATDFILEGPVLAIYGRSWWYLNRIGVHRVRNEEQVRQEEHVEPDKEEDENEKIEKQKQVCVWLT